MRLGKDCPRLQSVASGTVSDSKKKPRREPADPPCAEKTRTLRWVGRKRKRQKDWTLIQIMNIQFFYHSALNKRAADQDVPSTHAQSK
jgi:hypothetical protein